jgi:hypothetical protein
MALTKVIGEGVGTLTDDLTIPQKIIHSGDTDTHITLADNQIDLTAGNVNIFQGFSNEVVINQGGADVNFRVEGDADASLLIVDAGEDNVKIGSSAGNYGKLSIRNEAAGAQERGLYIEVAPASGTSPNNVAVFSAANGNLTTPVVRIHHESPTADQLLLQATTTGSNTVKFSVDEDGDAYVAGGLLVGGTGTANLLNDYEEGTFTADLDSSGATITQSVSRGDYTKIGNTVYFNIYVQCDGTLSGNSNRTDILGLPFTSVNNSQRVYFNACATRYANLDNGYNSLFAYINNNDNKVQLFQVGDNAVLKDFPSANLSNVSGQVLVQGFYHVS